MTACLDKSFCGMLILMQSIMSSYTSSSYCHRKLWYIQAVLGCLSQVLQTGLGIRCPALLYWDHESNSSEKSSRRLSGPLILYSHSFASLIVSKWLYRRLLIEIERTLFPLIICQNFLEMHFPHTSVALETKWNSGSAIGLDELGWFTSLVLHT